MKLSLTFHLRRNFRQVEDKKSRRWDAGGQVWGVTRALGARLHLFFCGLQREVVLHGKTEVTRIAKRERATVRVERAARSRGGRLHAVLYALLVEHVDDIRRERQLVVGPSRAVLGRQAQVVRVRQGARRSDPPGRAGAGRTR